jgi:hypothetical protein
MAKNSLTSYGSSADSGNVAETAAAAAAGGAVGSAISEGAGLAAATVDGMRSAVDSLAGGVASTMGLKRGGDADDASSSEDAEKKTTKKKKKKKEAPPIEQSTEL